MFLQLNHKKPEVYKISRELVKECYQFIKLLPAEEKFSLVSQIRRATLSVKLNIAEGAWRKSEAERKRFYEMSRGSLIEIDAAFESACDLSYYSVEQLDSLNIVVNKCFAMLTGLIAK